MKLNHSTRTQTMTIFVLFFGISLLDALTSHNWWRASFWILMGVVFYVAARAPDSD